jgi:hypothetical protein
MYRVITFASNLKANYSNYCYGYILVIFYQQSVLQLFNGIYLTFC